MVTVNFFDTPSSYPTTIPYGIPGLSFCSEKYSLTLVSFLKKEEILSGNPPGLDYFTTLMFTL